MMAVIWDDGRHCSNSMQDGRLALTHPIKKAIINTKNAVMQPKICRQKGGILALVVIGLPPINILAGLARAQLTRKGPQGSFLTRPKPAERLAGAAGFSLESP